jgi:hypothetical protein
MVLSCWSTRQRGAGNGRVACQRSHHIPELDPQFGIGAAIDEPVVDRAHGQAGSDYVGADDSQHPAQFA